MTPMRFPFSAIRRVSGGFRYAPLRGNLGKSEPEFERGLPEPCASNHQLIALSVYTDDKLQSDADLVPLRGVRLIDAGPNEDLFQHNLTELLVCGNGVVH